MKTHPLLKYIVVIFPTMIVACASLALAQTRTIVVAGVGAEGLAQLQSISAEAKIVPAEKERAALLEQVADADAIIGWVDRDIFLAAKKLKWIQTHSAGVEGYGFPELVDSDVTLTNVKIFQGPEIADHAFALLLALTRDLYKTIPRQQSAEWKGSDINPIELRGKTALVVGVGGIGMQIAQRAHAFDMRVIGVDPKDIPLTYFVSKVVPPDRLDTVLPEADVVFVAAPLTPETEGMFNAKRFELMKKGSYFVIVSRGKLYDSEALLKAIESGKLAGAGLDVTNPEPLPKDHPLWKQANVLITPHVAGRSDEIQKRRMELFRENILRFAKGEPLLNIVDKRKGY